MKPCRTCNTEKPLDEYHRNKRTKDGRVARCKTCSKAQKAEYYAANRDALLAQKAKYYTENRERIIAQVSKHSSRPEVKAQIVERKAEYYQENRASIRAHAAEYYQAHPEARWEYGFRRRAEMYGFEPAIEPFTRDELIARWGDECFHCKGEWSELDHHPVPVAHGGEHTLENTKPSCVTCNRPGGAVTRLNKKDTGEAA